mgnify:CR=1 FL=1
MDKVNPKNFWPYADLVPSGERRAILRRTILFFSPCGLLYGGFAFVITYVGRMVIPNSWNSPISAPLWVRILLVVGVLTFLIRGRSLSISIRVPAFSYLKGALLTVALAALVFASVSLPVWLLLALPYPLAGWFIGMFEVDARGRAIGGVGDAGHPPFLS